MNLSVKFTGPVIESEIRFHQERATLLSRLKESVVAHRALVFMDAGLGKIWRHRVVGFGVPQKQIVILKAGEAAKKLSVVGAALEMLTKRGHERSSPIIVIGGGAACDVVALLASLYRRGVPLQLVPTTLLAMVDASVGGKTAVDLVRAGKTFKNVAGTFYPAQGVDIWPDWLATLPLRERLSGMAELLKTLWIAGESFDLSMLKAWVGDPENTSAQSALWPLIIQSVKTKARLVEQDPFDNKKIRNILNFGHSIGHALESTSRGKLSHGEAIAWGMVMETKLIDPEGTFAAEVEHVVREIGYETPKWLKSVDTARLVTFLRADKKMENGKIVMSLLRGPGKSETFLISPTELARFINSQASQLLETRTKP